MVADKGNQVSLFVSFREFDRFFYQYFQRMSVVTVTHTGSGVGDMVRAWNKETVDDKKIAEDLYELSNGELQMTDDIVRLMAERLNQNYRPKTNYTNNRQNNKRRY